MKKLNSVIMETNFKKFFKWFIVASLVVVILGSVATGVAFRTQISEAISYERTFEREEDGFREYAEDEEWNEKTARQYAPGNQSVGVSFTEPSTAAKIIAGAFGCLCVLIFAAYWLSVVAWLYKAAVSSDMNRWFWPIAGLFANLATVILFLLARSVCRVKCPACGLLQKKSAKYCAKCGSRMQTNCPSCGENCAVGDLYCRACGSKL